MAYKFQLGKAKLSGSIETAQEITSQGGLTVNGLVDLDAGVISNVELEKSSVMFNGVTVALGATGSFGTDAVTEGSTNKYYTDARARAAVSVTDVSGDGSLSYDNSTGVITYTGPSASEVRAHLSAGEGLKFAGGEFAVTSSIAGAGLAWSAGVLSVDTAEIAAGLSGSVEAMIGAFVEGSDFVTFDDVNGTIGVDAPKFSGSFSAALASKSTTDLAEGSNKYFTDARARSAVSAVDAGGDGSFSYNSATGVFTYTGPSATEARVHFSALTGAAYQNGNIQYNSATGQITLQPVEESWVRQRLGAVDAVKYNTGSGQISLQLSGTSLQQSAGGLKTDIKAKIGAYNNSGSIVYNNDNGELTFSPVDPAWVKGRFSAGAGLDYDGNGQFSVGNLEVTNGMLAGSIENGKLVNSSVTVNGTAGEVTVVGSPLALGGTATISLPSTISKNLAFSGEVTINKLNVTGTLTTINTTNLEVKDERILMASGSTGWATGVGFDFGSHVDHGTLLTAEVDLNGDGVGAADNVLSSSLPLVAPSMKAGTFYGNFVGASILGIVTEGASTATISANVTRANNASQVLTLPSAPAVGQEHRIKCVVADASSPVITIQPASGAKLEGVVDAQITLESYGAAISLVWGGSSEGWMVF